MTSLLYRINISHHYDAIKLKELLAKEFPRARIQFDLTEKHGLLRIEGDAVPSSRVVQLIKHAGFYCEYVEEDLKP